MEKSTKTVLRTGPGGPLMDLSEPSETYGIYGMGATSGHLGKGRKLICFHMCPSSACFLKFLINSIDFGIRIVPKMDRRFLSDCVWMSSRYPPVGPEASRKRLGGPKYHQMIPQSAHKLSKMVRFGMPQLPSNQCTTEPSTCTAYSNFVICVPS